MGTDLSVDASARPCVAIETNSHMIERSQAGPPWDIQVPLALAGSSLVLKALKWLDGEERSMIDLGRVCVCVCVGGGGGGVSRKYQLWEGLWLVYG